MHPTHPLMVLTLLVCGAIGCGSDPAARRPTTWTRGPSMSPEQMSALMARKSKASLEIDDRIARACAMPAAHFAFHSDRIEEDARSALDAVAACFAIGPLRGRRMAVVGHAEHADPRGKRANEAALSIKRVGRVAEYIERRGVESSQIATTSGDGLEARGEGAAGAPKRRRVQILLVD